MKTLTFTLLLFCLMTASAVLAQSNPTVEVVLSQPTAQQGDTITADVYVRNPLNLAGADIGITTDDQCLKIVDRQAGSLLPDSTNGAGAFSPFSELKDHETRLAVAVTDRTKIANSDGIFFTVKMQVMCATGTAPVTVSFGELSAYKDPKAAEVELVAYTMSAGTLNTVNAQLAVGPAGQVTAIPTQPVPTSVVPIQPTSVAPVTGPTPTQSPLVLAIILIIIVTIVIFVVLVIVSRRRNNE